MATNDKLAAAAHLVIARLREDQLGATKLNKILWFADCEFYHRHGRSLTGETAYVRKDQGPCPQRMETVLSRLKTQGRIVEQPQTIATYKRREFTAVVEPDITELTAEEVDVLLRIALELAHKTAAQVSELSHDDLWEATDPYALMSVKAGSVRIRPPSQKGMEWARQVFAAE